MLILSEVKAMCIIYGYCRISTTKQNIERQITNIKSIFPSAVIITESFTGTKMERPSWSKLYKRLTAGDTIVFDEVSRMSRNAEEGFAVYQELFARGVNLIFLKERHIDTAVFREATQAPETGDKDLDETLIRGLNEYLMRLAKKQIQIAFEQSQSEVDHLHQRTSEGVRRAQAEGKQVGRATGAKITTHKEQAAREIITKHNRDFGGALSDSETMKLAGISRNSFYKYKRNIKSGIT
jgi:DNA invertase Pin-like site-specific DNA recombinase